MIPAAKPTLYRDTMFRSRLEARWAAFFDLAGWRWDYEPCDFDGWTPDFRLNGVESIYAEVKPIAWHGAGPEQVLQEHGLRKVLDCRREVRADPGDFTGELLVLGDGPQRIGADVVLGVFVDEAWGAGPDWALLCKSESAFGPPLDFCSVRGAYAYRITGRWEGNSHVDPVNDNLAEAAWRMAGSRVQWKGDGAYSGPVGPLLRDLIEKLGGGE